jgi:hypothetical protein
MQGRNPVKVGGLGSGRRLGQILVPGEVNGDPKLRSDGRLDDPKDPAAATNPHVLAQSNLRRHDQGKFDRLPDTEWIVGVKERSARAEILREARSFVLRAR